MGTLVFSAAVLGDAVNYAIGFRIGEKAYSMNSKVIKTEYLIQTQKFYETYGGKSVVLARFVPIVRTFAPFLAGVAKMKYSLFFKYNAIGALVWTGLLVSVGYFFGNLPIVKNNFTLVILGIILVSVAPAIFHVVKRKMN